MQRSWGGSEVYTEAQAGKALQHFSLGGPFVAIAYAGLLSEADYVDMAARLPRVLPYDLAREAFERAKPWPEHTWDPQESMGIAGQAGQGHVSDGGGFGHSSQ
jgi:hypothetical protein